MLQGWRSLMNDSDEIGDFRRKLLAEVPPPRVSKKAVRRAGELLAQSELDERNISEYIADASSQAEKLSEDIERAVNPTGKLLESGHERLAILRARLKESKAWVEAFQTLTNW